MIFLEYYRTNCLNLIQISPHTKEISFKDEAIYSTYLSSCLGQTVYGRVSWNPEQDLQSAYKLSIQKVYLCAGIFIKLKSCYRILLKENRWCFYCSKKPTLFPGKNGYIPNYDPEGDIFGEGKQFGCVQPSPELQFRFLILVCIIDYAQKFIFIENGQNNLIYMYFAHWMSRSFYFNAR